MIREPSSFDEPLAWYGVVVDPARRVDQAIEARQSMKGKVVLEVGRHALAHALRHAPRAGQVFAAETGPTRPTMLDLPPNVSRLHASNGSIPLRDKTIDVAILRCHAPDGGPLQFPIGVDELDRLTAPEGLSVGVQKAVAGALGELMSGVFGNEALGQAAQVARLAFESAGYIEELVEVVWQAPGRSILRRLLAAEWGEAEAIRTLAVSELDGAYRIFWKRYA